LSKASSAAIGRFIVNDAIASMALLITKVSDRAVLFERYVSDQATFEALIMGFFTFGLKFHARNIVETDGRPVDYDAEPDRLRKDLATYLAVELNKVAPERWHLLTLIDELSALQ
jgi:hypothetical protein